MLWINQTFNSYYLEMKIPNNYKRLESCSKEELIEKIIVRDKHCNDLKKLLDKWLKKYKELEEENRNLKSELSKFSEAYKKYRDYEKEELAESCYDLARENEKLKEEIGKLVMN